MKKLLVVTALLESGAGILLLILPAYPVSILFGPSVVGDLGLLLGRLAGAAIISLGVACWLAHNDEKSPAATGLTAAMLLFDITAFVLLAYAGLGLSLSGVGLWPAVFIHIALAVWCIKCIRERKMKEKN